MIRKLRTSISKPKMTVFFIKDRFSSVIVYMLLLTTLLIIPNLIKMAVDKDLDLERKTQITESLKALNDFEIENGTLIISRRENIAFDIFNLSLGETEFIMRYNIVFTENDLVFYAAHKELKRSSYKDLGIDNFQVNKVNFENYQILTNVIADFVKTESAIKVTDLFYAYFVNLMDYFTISIMLVFMTMFFPTIIKFNFGSRLKMTIYLMTSWVLTQLIVKLFQIEFLELISLVVVYIYHIILYRFLRTLKVEIINVEK